MAVKAKKGGKQKRKEMEKRYVFSIRYHFVSFGLACVVFAIFALIFHFVFTPVQKAHAFCANSISCITNLSGNYQQQYTGVFMGQKVVTPSRITTDDTVSPVLGVSTMSDKHIYIDLTNQRLYAFEGNKMAYDFLVSTGKWHATPTGDFRIWIKLRYATMVGGDPSIGDYYNLPNVPYIMYFSNTAYPKSEGYGIHGTYWHHNFGSPMTDGCISMKTQEAAQLYNWVDPPTAGNAATTTDTNPGTPVSIYGVTPN